MTMFFRAQTFESRCLWLSGAEAAVWLLTLGPCSYFFGGAGVEATTVSALACALAGIATFWLVARITEPRVQAFAALFGTVIRGSFAALAAIIMQFVLGLTYQNYLIWLAIFYLLSLLVETILLMGDSAKTSSPV
jgi:hypothetical protein